MFIAIPGHCGPTQSTKNPAPGSLTTISACIERNSGMLMEAEADLNRSLEIKPENIEAIMNLGVLAQVRGGNLDTAIKLLRQAAAISEQDPIHGAAYSRVYYHLGAVFKQKGEPQAALEAFYAAVEGDHHNLDAINAVGVLLMDMNRIETRRFGLIRRSQSTRFSCRRMSISATCCCRKATCRAG